MKRTLAILLALLMVLALVACGTPATDNPGTEPGTNPGTEPGTNPVVDDSLAGTYEITVWVGEAAVELTKKQIENFNNTNEYGIKFVATVNPVSEGDAASQMLVDVTAGADIFCFAQDQFARLVQGNALIELDDEAAKIVTEANEPGASAAATTGSKMYAYPLTADNGYFMYYDKRVVKDEDVDSLEKIIADCEAANKNFAFECGSAWYLAAWFFATGCKSDWTTGDDGSFISVADTFNSDEGLISVKGLKQLVDSPCYLSSSSADVFANNGAVVVTGIWNYEIIKGLLGDNMGVADLPSFTVDGKEYHLGSYHGFKLMGIKPQADADRQIVLQLLVEYLTDEDRQMERFEALSWGPSNLNAQKTEAVQNHPGLSALWQQKQYATLQGQVHGSWWDIAKVITDDVKAATDDAGLKAALDNYYNKIAALFTMTQEEKEAWSVIGTICGTNWDTDIPMHETEKGVFESDPLELKAKEEFKVRQGASWDVNYGMKDGVTVAGGMDTNVVVPADDTYIIKFDTNTLTLSFANLQGVLPEGEPEPEPDPEAKHTWALIGAIGETNWDYDFVMREKDDGLFRIVIYLTTDNAFKVRADADWALNYGITEGVTEAGGKDIKVEEDGTYLIILDPNPEAPALTVEKLTITAWGVVGSFAGSNWGNDGADVVMTEKEPGVWVSEAFALKAGDLFKVRADGAWDINYGVTEDVVLVDGENITVEADGNYIVTLDLVNLKLTFEPAA